MAEKQVEPADKGESRSRLVAVSGSTYVIGAAGRSWTDSGHRRSFGGKCICGGRWSSPGRSIAKGNGFAQHWRCMEEESNARSSTIIICTPPIYCRRTQLAPIQRSL